MQEIFNRRSIRKFRSQKVEREKINRMLEAAMQAPSAHNQRAWEFVVVDDPSKLTLLSRATPYSGLIAGAPIGIVLACNTAKLKNPEIWQQDMGACAQNILLEAVHLELGACWMGVAPSDERMETVRKILQMPPSIDPFGMIAVGYPAEGQKNQFIDRFDRTAIHSNAW